MSITTRELESESGATVLRQHECAENKLPELLRLCLVTFGAKDKKEIWEIFSIWVATQEDVKEGEADAVGELMNLSSITVNYCPFCGADLHES